jgi:hypothetical protein
LVADEPARLTIRLLDENGATTPARAWVDVEGGRLFEPVAPDSVTPYDRDLSFSCDGVFTMEVPEGIALVHIEKGKEYLPVDLRLDVQSGTTVERTIQLERWIDMPSEGWYSGDLHVHLGQDDPRVLRQLALADDVHLIPAFTYWLGGGHEEWHGEWPDATYTEPIEVDPRHFITRNNVEVERIYKTALPGGSSGAVFLYDLNLPVSVPEHGTHFPTNAAISREARTHSPAVVLDSDKPSWAETVVSAGLGVLDTIQVCHNHYQRDSTSPGGWGMIGPLLIGESNAASGDGLFHRTNDLYYRFLNCGFPLGVSGGSAIGVMSSPAGYSRVYARIDGPMTVAAFWEAIKAGRSFATTGPMLDLTADGEGLGATVSRSSTGAIPVQLHTTVQSIVPLESLQIVHNGLVIASTKLIGESPNPVLVEQLSYDLLPVRSGWVAARAFFRAEDGLLRQAHTSPIYLSIDGKPIAFADDAEFMLRWLDRLESIARRQPDRYPTEAAREAVLDDLSQARARYREIVKYAEAHWGNRD